MRPSAVAILLLLLVVGCGAPPAPFPSGVTLGPSLKQGVGSDFGLATVDGRGDLWVPEADRALDLVEMTRDGQRRQLPVQPPLHVAYFAGTAAGAGEDVWFLALPQGVTGGVVGHATPGGVTYVQLPDSEGYGAMAVAGDGSLWLVGHTPSEAVLRRVAADARSSRTFPLGVPFLFGAVVPAGGDGAWAIAAGPGASDRIVRATPSGVTMAATLEGTVASLIRRPDGGAWVLYQPSAVDHVQCRAAVLSTAGVLEPALATPLEDVPALPTRGPYVPTPDEACPAGTAGPDGSLWLGEHTQCFPHGCIPHSGPWRLLHVTQDGHVSRTPLPDRGEIAVRPALQGGLVWALELAGDTSANLAVAIDASNGSAHEYREPRLPGYVIDPWVRGEGPALWVVETAALVRLVPATP